LNSGEICQIENKGKRTWQTAECSKQQPEFSKEDELVCGVPELETEEETISFSADITSAYAPDRSNEKNFGVYCGIENHEILSLEPGLQKIWTIFQTNFILMHQ